MAGTMEERDRELAAALLAFVEVTPDLVVRWDGAGRLSHANVAACERFRAAGQDPPAALSQLFTRTSLAVVRDHVQPVVASGRAWSGELAMAVGSGLPVSAVV